MTPQPSPQPHAYFDQHTIETPEQMSLRFPLAGIGSRFLALAIDTMIQAGFGFFLLLTFAIAAGALGESSSIWVTAILIVAIFMLMYGYFAIFEIVWNGQTPGKRVAGIRVVKDSGRPLTVVECLGRNLMRIVDQLPAAYMVGIIVAMCNAQNKRLGDYVAGSIVVREKALHANSLDEARPVAQAAPESALHASALTEADLVLIDTFLSRRFSLPPEIRHVTAVRILERVSINLPPRAGDGRSVETVLEALAYERRSTGA